MKSLGGPLRAKSSAKKLRWMRRKSRPRAAAIACRLGSHDTASVRAAGPMEELFKAYCELPEPFPKLFSARPLR